MPQPYYSSLFNDSSLKTFRRNEQIMKLLIMKRFKSSYCTGSKVSANLSYVTVREEEKMERAKGFSDLPRHLPLQTNMAEWLWAVAMCWVEREIGTIKSSVLSDSFPFPVVANLLRSTRCTVFCLSISWAPCLINYRPEKMLSSVVWDILHYQFCAWSLFNYSFVNPFLWSVCLNKLPSVSSGHGGE